MSNQDAAFGFKPLRTINGGDWKAAEITVAAGAGYAIDLFTGSPVKLSGDFILQTTSSSQQYFSEVTLSAANEAIDYIITGFTPQFITEEFGFKFGKASTLRFMQAVPVQGTIFEIQANGVVATTASALNANITAEVGSTLTGNSTVELDTATLASTATHALLVTGVSKDRNNNDLVSANPNIEVIINKTLLTPGSAGIA